MDNGQFEEEQSSFQEIQPPEPQPPKKPQKTSPGFAESVFLYLHDIVCLMIVVILILVVPLRVVVVSGSSMKNTLVDGDYLLLLSNALYRNPEQGDIIVAAKDSFREGEPIIKRIIALEGQTVDIDFENAQVFVDGKLLEETYLGSLTTNQEGIVFPLTVEPGCIFVLGDNRTQSLDSRSREVGLIDQRDILGKAIFLMIPGTDKGTAPRDFSRMGGFWK